MVDRNPVNFNIGANMPPKTPHKVSKHSKNNSRYTAAESRRSREVQRAAESDGIRGPEAGHFAEGAAKVGELARGREMQAAVTALAAGFGIGIVLGGVIAGSRRRAMVDESFGRRVLGRMERMVPDTISKRLKT
ncbi:MAG TPA: hypothetical protein VGM76_02545 [Lacipirellulaceae bacterium]